MGKRTGRILTAIIMLSVVAAVVATVCEVMGNGYGTYAMLFAVYLVCLGSFVLLYDRLG